jgi:4-hydroxy-tetrahydrodipicolinate synthase
MRYSKREAKSYAKAHLRGIWAAALQPFRADGSLDEEGFRRNIHHWTAELGIDGIFVGGKQGEFFSMSLAERKRACDIAVAAVGDRAATIVSCSDQNMDTVIELARYAQHCGADYIVVHAPVLSFLTARDETLLRYYTDIASKVDIGIALWSHIDSGYLMSPQLCNRIADIENVVAIKYSVPRDMYAELTRLASDRLIVSTSSEEEWLDNIVELDWRLYLSSTPPYLLQSAADRRMRRYTDLAFDGQVEAARKVRDSLAPVRRALKDTRPAEKPHAQQKYWQELLGQTGGAVRRPLLDLSAAEKAVVRRAFDGCGLRVAA